MKSSLFLASMLVVGMMATPTSAQTAKEGSISGTVSCPNSQSPSVKPRRVAVRRG
jgi:hypothetical protein